jgi:hypothetical protein
MKKLIMTRRRDDPGSAVNALAMTGLVGVLLLASATCVLAQVPRNGPEWGGKDHQPTEAGVIGREDRAGVRAPAAELEQNARSVEQLGRQLLHDEAVDPPGAAGGSASE